MKLISWNVNGIRAVIRKGFKDFLTINRPDILCLQEIKISQAAREKEAFDFIGYREYWNPATRPGYSGTAVLLRDDLPEPVRVLSGLGEEKFDSEGRTQILEFADFYLFNCYFPNSQPELARLDYKLEYDQLLLKKAKLLEKNKPVIVCGDYNVAHEEIDLARPKENVGNPGFTNEEREAMTKFLASGFLDSFRYLHPQKIQYSWWSFRAGARARNVGWRIDYFGVSASLAPLLKEAFILDKVEGSDHAPIGLEINLFR